MSDFQPKIKLELTLPEVNFILETLGHIKLNQVSDPIKTAMLMVSIKEQATKQLTQEVKPAETNE